MKIGETGKVPAALIVVIALSILAVGVTFLGEGIIGREGIVIGEIPSREEAVNRTFRIGVEGEIMRYRETYTWSEINYRSISEDRELFRTRELQKFEESYELEPTVYEFIFIYSDFSTLFRNEIRERVVKNENKYTGDFEWFLNAHGLDFIENQFRGTETGLTWNGEIGEIPTEIVIDLPLEEIGYSEWGEPAGYGHTEIWWSEEALE